MTTKRTKPENFVRRPNTSLNAKQELFCQHYMALGNATQAALRAGYSERSAHVQGTELLKKPLIASRIRELTEERNARLQITADEAVRNIVHVYQIAAKVVPVKDRAGKPVLDAEGNPLLVLSEGKTAVKAAELLARMTGALTDRITLESDTEAANILSAARRRVDK